MRRQSRRLPREHTRTRQHDGIGIHVLLVRPRCKLAASQLLNFSKVVGTFGTATAGVLFDRQEGPGPDPRWKGWGAAHERQRHYGRTLCSSRHNLDAATDIVYVGGEGNNVNYIGRVQLPAITKKTETFLGVDPDGIFFLFLSRSILHTCCFIVEGCHVVTI